MKKILVFIFLNSYVFAYVSHQEVKYESGISFYGKVGIVNVIFNQNLHKHTYKMKVIAHSTGLVKVLSGNRVDIFISEGNIVNNIYRPKKFTRITTKNNYKKVTTYTFDYANNIVHKTVKKEVLVTGTKFDVHTFKIVKKSEMQKENKSEEIKLIPNDYLSLYLNLQAKNLQSGSIQYIDKNKKNKLFLLNDYMFEVQKDNGKKKYKIILKDDKNSIFFKEALSLHVAFYGNAYIRKIWETKN